MKLSVSEKRLAFLALAGLLLLLGFAFEKMENRDFQSDEQPVQRKTVQFPIDINSATYEELLEIPGIGPAKARSILDYRESNGPFQSIEDLTNVSGIGRATAEKMASFVDLKHNSFENKKVNINRADLEKLSELPGIGEVKASEIIKFREQNGPFEKPEDLLEVPGIGPKTLDKIRDMIDF
ncbi:ComEA family DNA-binding protein [Pseudothermotoga lettingae]|uniref:ComEA family DNA-binding protein n=1 Tax=Pseudothermotoga lettingae TaxID=177758 RepID=UPI000748BE03|nr:ComEA family DNA-binding protein [Pseudothermotoga lettingae]KUK21385.1 MAG: Competence protein ComEA helix-hairpin-helix repeat protein [Pseudothermotoga lettingae]